jgi:hypothetical protein
MAGKLNQSMMIRTLAADLGLKPDSDPVSAISSYCHKKVKRFLSDFPTCSNPKEFLDCVANKSGTEFREIHSDADLAQARSEFLEKKEAGFVRIHEELNGEVLGITLKRLNSQPWELPYISIIDCRGENRIRSYYTKWHELVHLLILTDQTRLVFRRTHTEGQAKSPEESLVDVIAGSFAFYPPIVRERARGEISFEKIEAVRANVFPESSQQSALLGIAKSWPSACILIEARLAHKAGEGPGPQRSFSFKRYPAPVLRAVHANVNDEAKKMGVKVIPHFRVPKDSVIYKVFTESIPYAENTEELASWTSSGGERWVGGTVLVKARLRDDGVQALLVPIKGRKQ